MESTITRIAMWSGPRNVSTALMRSWENRADTFVIDEPFYAYYLAETGILHPGREKVLATQPTAVEEVIAQCINGTDSNHIVQYQKHMTHHMLDNVPLDWLHKVHNIFLLREPEAVISSYSKVVPDLGPADLGFEQQQRIYQFVVDNIDPHPLIIHSHDLLKNPALVLGSICDKCSIRFDEAMLSWPAGPRASDGAWAAHWYANVEKSTGFSPYNKREISLSPQQQVIAASCRPFYESLSERATAF